MAANIRPSPAEQDSAYCCLGVAVEAHPKAYWSVEDVKYLGDDESSVMASAVLPGGKFCKIGGEFAPHEKTTTLFFDDKVGLHWAAAQTFVYMNDELHYTFAEIGHIVMYGGAVTEEQMREAMEAMAEGR